MSNRAISTELIELGERIRKRRQEMKLSQESFGCCTKTIRNRKNKVLQKLKDRLETL